MAPLALDVMPYKEMEQYPLSTIVSNKDEHFQLKFAGEAFDIVGENERVKLEKSNKGLIVNGITEDDIYDVIQMLSGKYTNISNTKLVINYIEGDTTLEPYMKVRAASSEEYFGDVVVDINKRHGIVTEMAEEDSYKVVLADIPLSELFGYKSGFAKITQGNGKFDIKFRDYRPKQFSGPGPNELA